MNDDVSWVLQLWSALLLIQVSKNRKLSHSLKLSVCNEIFFFFYTVRANSAIRRVQQPLAVTPLMKRANFMSGHQKHLIGHFNEQLPLIIRTVYLHLSCAAICNPTVEVVGKVGMSKYCSTEPVAITLFTCQPHVGVAWTFHACTTRKCSSPVLVHKFGSTSCLHLQKPKHCVKFISRMQQRSALYLRK